MTFGTGEDWQLEYRGVMSMARTQHTWLMAIGLALWFTTGWESFYWLGFGLREMSLGDEVWAIAFVCFALALGGQLALGAQAVGSRRWAALIALQSAAALTMTAFPCHFSQYLVAYVAWHAGLVFTLRTALSFAGIQGLGFAAVAMAVSNGSITVIGSNLVLQLLAVSSAVFAVRESRGRSALMKSHAELSLARDQLAEQTVAAERGRIAREIHDVLGHHLAALSLQLEVASHQTEGRGRDAVARAQSLATSLLGDVRLVVDVYRSNAPIDVRAALEKLLCGLERPIAQLTVKGDVQIEHPVLTHTLIRCVQELITNVLKHAKAEHLWVEVERTDHGLLATVRDDGGGCPELRPGFGLSGMRERLSQVNGELAIECVPGGGIVATVKIPLAARTSS